MAKIDEIKEILNTLRIALSITIGIIVVLIGSIVNRYDANMIDGIFLDCSFDLLCFNIICTNNSE